MNRGRRHQRGVALVVALLTVALAVILVAGLLDRGELAMARVRNTLRGSQARAYAQGLESYAAAVLAKDWAEDRAYDANGDIWAMPLPPQDVPGGRIGATMRDLGGCLNLNNLAAPDSATRETWRAVFRRLLGVRGVSADLADAVGDWLDADADPASGNGAEDAAYLASAIPYRSANRVFAHVSELRLVRGFDGAAYARMAPWLCALPPGTRLNLNTASVAVLESLDAHIGQALAERLWNQGRAQWHGVDEFAAELQRLGLPPLSPVLIGELAVSSDYFLARGDVVLDTVPFTFYSLIERNGGRVRVLERSRGSDDALVAPALPWDTGAD
jgi:general secretion pathway protein K